MKRALFLLAGLPLLLAADGDIPELLLPIACKIGQSCFIQNYFDVDPSPGVRDYHCGARSYDGHDGVDYRIRSMAEQRVGVPVLAAADGTVAYIRDGMPDISVAIAGKASVAGKECGNAVQLRHGREILTGYCHMAQGSVAVKPGQRVKAGDMLGKVGMSGAAEFPHLHFLVRRQGRVVDPFAYGAGSGRCDGGRELWSPAAGSVQAYRAGEVINAGFATGAVTMGAAQERGVNQQPRPTRAAAQFAVFVQAINLEGGDVQSLVFNSPDGSLLAENRAEPLERNKAQTILWVAKKRRSAAWPAGRYSARYQLIRKGKVVIDRRFGITLD